MYVMSVIRLYRAVHDGSRGDIDALAGIQPYIAGLMAAPKEKAAA